VFEKQEIGDNTLSVGGSGFGTSEHVIERLNNYICNSGLIDTDNTPKQSWNVFKKQIQMID